MPSRTFAQSRSAVPVARHYVVEVLADLPADLTATAALLVSELAANAVLHGAGPFEVSVVCGADLRSVRVEVIDAGAGQPAVQEPDQKAEHGRGLQLVDALADAWGIRRDSGTKTVWFELAAP